VFDELDADTMQIGAIRDSGAISSSPSDTSGNKEPSALRERPKPVHVSGNIDKESSDKCEKVSASSGEADGGFQSRLDERLGHELDSDCATSQYARSEALSSSKQDYKQATKSSSSPSGSSSSSRDSSAVMVEYDDYENETSADVAHLSPNATSDCSVRSKVSLKGLTANLEGAYALAANTAAKLNRLETTIAELQNELGRIALIADECNKEVRAFQSRDRNYQVSLDKKSLTLA
jgi:hypothetical protein